MLLSLGQPAGTGFSPHGRGFGTRGVGTGVPLLLLLGLPMLLASSAGCATPFAPLGRYNDAWAGVLRVRGQEVSVRLEIFITRNDQRDEREPPHSKPCFGEFTLDEVGPLSAQGQISHYDFSAFEKESHSPQPGREFLDMQLQHISAAALEGGSPEDQGRTQAAHERLLGRLGPELASHLGEVTLYGERLPGGPIQGIAVLNQSSTGECAHKDDDGRCSQWRVNSRRVRIGTFTLWRTRQPAVFRHIDDNTVESRAFVFRRHQEGPGHLGWWVELRPRPSVPPKACPPTGSVEQTRGELAPDPPVPLPRRIDDRAPKTRKTNEGNAP